MPDLPPKLTENECRTSLDTLRGLSGFIKTGMGVPSEYFDAIAAAVKDLAEVLSRMRMQTFPDAVSLDAFSPARTAPDLSRKPTPAEIDDALVMLGRQPRSRP